MGTFRQHIRLANFGRPDVEEIDANALVDSGAMELCVPASVARQLQLEIVGQRPVVVADGRRVTVDYAGAVRVEVFGRTAITGALVMGDQVLLGAIPMESMDVLIDPARLQLIPNPDSPDAPMSLAMGVRQPEREK